MALIFDVAAVCEEGGHPGNEDSWGSRQSGALGCWIVCDGAGGHGGGETASRLAVDEVLAYWDEQPRVAVADVAQALAEANAAVMAGQLSEARLSAMRSTAVLLAVDAQTGVAAWGNVGDSRLYLFRDGREFYRSRDHSMVQQLLDAGFVTGDPSRHHPKRNILTAALGSDDIALNVSEGTPPIQDGDAFLLCSDGFWEYVEEPDMEQALLGTRSAADALARLVPLVDERAPPNHDNFTAVLVRLQRAASADPEATRPVAPVDSDPDGTVF